MLSTVYEFIKLHGNPFKVQFLAEFRIKNNYFNEEKTFYFADFF